ncbi:MAG: hypothetical protein JWP25_3593 [Bradyrhizobium sp.]|nr:hypothetical protein [Bradyrhizobium sp.]
MTDEKRQANPQGIIAIMTSPDGDVIATATDFNRSGYGGYKLWEAQAMRAKDQVKWATVRAYCSPVVSDALDSYLMGQVADRLCSKGHKITLRAVGYPDDVRSEIERR